MILRNGARGVRRTVRHKVDPTYLAARTRRSPNGLLSSCRSIQRTRPTLSILNGSSDLRDCVRLFSSASDLEVRQLHRLLTTEESTLLEDQRAVVEKARQLASKIEAVEVKPYPGNFLREILPDSDDHSTFSIVVAGEFNAGKSTVINALLGKKLLETGALPTTDCITILTHGNLNDVQHNAGGHGGVILHQVSNVPLLQDLTLVDTPGTNAVVMNHTARTMKLLPTADLILFVTSADRPFPESERLLLQSIQAYRKSIVVVINKMDILEASGGNHGEDEKRRVVDFVTENASELLGARPIVIPISARDAISAKINQSERVGQSGLWTRSNFVALESFLKDTLTTETKIKSKLMNPLGVAEGMMAECLQVLEEEKRELGTDIATLNLLRSQFAGWKIDIEAEMAGFRRSLGDVIRSEGDGCQRLVNRLGFVDQYLWSIQAGKLEAEWNKTRRGGVGATRGLEGEALEIIREMADSVATRARAQGQAVIEYLGRRPAMKRQSLVGSVTAASRFEDTRKTLFDKMSESVQSVLSDNDDLRQKKSALHSIRQIAFVSGVSYVGAIGLTIATAAQVVQVTQGLAGSLTMAVLGALVASQGNARVAKEYKASYDLQQARIDEALEALCYKELQRVYNRILEGVAPYTRYVETEQMRVQSMTEDCEDIIVSARTLRNRISKLRHR